MQIRNLNQKEKVNTEVLKALECAMNRGLTNNEVDFFTKPQEITFKEYLGAIRADGYFGPYDKVPAGLIIYQRENFTGVPSAIFETESCEVAFYALDSLVERYAELACINRKELTEALVSLENEAVVVNIHNGHKGSELYDMNIYGYIPNSFAGEVYEAPGEDAHVKEMKSIWDKNYRK